jgi:ferredoxin, 2Fe-2S
LASLTIIDRDGQEKTVNGIAGRSVMENLRLAGFDEILAICGGNCACGTCHVYIEAGPPLPPASEDETDLLDCSVHCTDRSRLSCQIPFDDGLDGLVVRIAPEE